MRIALVTDTYTPQVNGVTTVVVRIANVLREFGHNVAIVAPRYPGYASLDPTQLRIPSASFPPYPAIRLSLPQFAVVARFLDRDKLADVYASADICVLPSRTATCGLVALEAMASGLAVGAADAGGFRESIALLKQYASAAVLAGTGAAPFAA